MKRTKNQWQDHYTRRAQKENYAARSVYKLAEIQKKHQLIRKGAYVLDLGCAPGSWLQYAAQQVGPSGKVWGVDLTPVKIKLPANVKTYRGDIYQLRDTVPDLFENVYHVLLSDMAPATTGSKFADSVRSFELSVAALNIAEELLRPGGQFVCKIFQGEDFKEFCDRVKPRFDKMNIFKPQSSRKASREIFVIGLGKR